MKTLVKDSKETRYEKERKVSITEVREELMKKLYYHSYYHNVLNDRIKRLYDAASGFENKKTDRQIHERTGRELQFLKYIGFVEQPIEHGPFKITDLGRKFMEEFDGSFDALNRAVKVKAVRDISNKY